MSIRIDGGMVVGWSGAGHEIVPGGSVLIEGNTIQSVGSDKSPAADRVIDASGKIVCPGFVNLHVHSQLNVGDYLLTDVTKKDYLAANWFVFGAPLKEKIETPPPPAVAIGAPELVAVPVFGMPFAVSSLYSPSGTRQTISPLLALMPNSSAHGGSLHGYPSRSR